MNWRVLLGVLLAAAGAAALVKALLLPGVLLVAAGVALLLWDAWRTAGAVLRLAQRAGVAAVPSRAQRAAAGLFFRRGTV